MAKLITPDMAVSDLYELSAKKYENDSLNNGNELDGEVVVTDYKPYDFNDIEEHIGTITAIENRITDIDYLIDDIEKSKGMNQAFALEAVRIVPDFNMPHINYYTKDITATRYKITLEELTGAMWALIASAVAALIAMIFKIVDWITGSSGRSSGRSSGGSSGGGPKVTTTEDIKKTEEKIKEIEENIDELKTKNYAQDEHPIRIDINNDNIERVDSASPHLSRTIMELINASLHNNDVANDAAVDNDTVVDKVEFIKSILNGDDKYVNNILTIDVAIRCQPSK